MRIALCADGRSSHTQRWANALVDRDLDVAVVWASEDFAGADFSGYRAPVSHHPYMRATYRRQPQRIPLAPLRVRRLAQSLAPDVVHGLFLSGYGWTAHALHVRPLVLSALGSDVLDLDRRTARSFPPGPATAYGAWRTRSAVAAANVVFADSTVIAEAVEKKVPGTRTELVRFGVEMAAPSPTARSEWRRRLNIDDDAFVVLSSRLVRPNYNIDTIIEAFAAARRRLPNAVLILKEYEQYSDDEYRHRCFALVDELGIGDGVRSVGELQRSELLDLHASADVYLSVPSRDGTAVSVLEAMAAGVALVATDAVGIDPLILRRDETALLVPPRDVRALSDAIVGLNRPERRDALAVRAREVVRRYGDFDRELDRAVEIYERLVVEQPQP
jgi:glycosyltransferase involved in cell wall biosynthesis